MLLGRISFFFGLCLSLKGGRTFNGPADLYLLSLDGGAEGGIEPVKVVAHGVSGPLYSCLMLKKVDCLKGIGATSAGASTSLGVEVDEEGGRKPRDATAWILDCGSFLI